MAVCLALAVLLGVALGLDYGVVKAYAVDTTPPVLTAGAVDRTSDTAATVKFTSDEAGRYYYAVTTSVFG